MLVRKILATLVASAFAASVYAQAQPAKPATLAILASSITALVKLAIPAKFADAAKFADTKAIDKVEKGKSKAKGKSQSKG